MSQTQGLEKRLRLVSCGILWMSLILPLGCVSQRTHLYNWRSVWGPTPTHLILIAQPQAVNTSRPNPMPGLLCRVYFFAKQDPIPIKACGDLIFTLHEVVEMEQGKPPLGRYRIAAAELATHLRRDIVGDSYVFWLPYAPETPLAVVVQAEFLPVDQTEPIFSGIVPAELDPAGVTKMPAMTQTHHSFRLGGNRSAGDQTSPAPSRLPQVQTQTTTLELKNVPRTVPAEASAKPARLEDTPNGNVPTRYRTKEEKSS